MPTQSKKLNIGIIGGSIAGLASAILISKTGANVTILERSENPLTGRGVGNALPEPLVNQCIDLGLFDKNIPHLKAASRTFKIKDGVNPEGKTIWTQPFSLLALNWADIYANLRKRIPDEHYHSGQEVVSIIQDDVACHVKTKKGDQFTFDHVIAADGINSNIRKNVFPDISPQYCDYVVWRGLLNLNEQEAEAHFKQNAHYYVFPKGHLLIYCIPDPHQKGDVLMNWVLYEDRKGKPLNELLIDKNGEKHDVSLPPGSLSESHIRYLNDLASSVLPPSAANIIRNTKEPFLQGIFDLQMPSFIKDRISFIGDAATVLRPHSSSGVAKALQSSITLSKVFEGASLAQWNEEQLALTAQQTGIAKAIGEGMVTDPPNWELMDQNSTAQWWDHLMKGRKWYAIPVEENPKTLTPYSDHQQGVKNEGLTRSEKPRTFKAKL